jgi:hypothetical protein
MKVYIVGEWGPEINTILSIHRTKEGIMKAWEKRRLEMLGGAKSRIKSSPENKKLYAGLVEVYSCKDPDKMQGLST